MATLLCSLLIGNKFSAYVVSGYATREVTLNDQRRVDCPFIPNDEKSSNDEEPKKINKYTLKDPINFISNFILELERRKVTKKLDEAKKIEDERIAEIDLFEKAPPDEFSGRRVHSWVVIIMKNRIEDKNQMKEIGEDEEVAADRTAFFIEPSTGFRHEVDSSCYMAIDSIWNDQNYYLNRQNPKNIPAIKWDLSNTDDWEHLLPAEPFEFRVDRPLPEDIESLTFEEELSKEKHLDMPISWVEKLHIGLPDFMERFPNARKTVNYKHAIYDKYSPYENKDGLSIRLTIYDTLNYEKALLRWEWYENREDLLEMIKINFTTKQIEENFVRGREDSLSFYSHNIEASNERIFKFYYKPRFDALKELKVHPMYIQERYAKRDDLLYFREFHIMKSENEGIVQSKILTKITEKFYRNLAKPAINDIAVRNFLLKENKISLRYHYDTDCITASTREFIKPQKPDYGQEIRFDPEATYGYKSNPLDLPESQLDLYLLLLQQLKEEETVTKCFNRRIFEIDTILTTRQNQMKIPKLTFSIFDPLRNQAARKLRLEKYEESRTREELSKKLPADFLSPYILYHENRKATPEESKNAYEACLNDLKQYYLDMLNELQRRYDELSSESKSLKKFLLKFQDQFDDYDYERFIKEGDELERNKRMMQQRIINVEEESQRKYEQLKKSLLKDERLDLSSI